MGFANQDQPAFANPKAKTFGARLVQAAATTIDAGWVSGSNFGDDRRLGDVVGSCKGLAPMDGDCCDGF